MLYKKLRNLLITTLMGILIVFMATTGVRMFNNSKIPTQPQTFTPKANTVYKIDMTEFKVKQVLKTNKIQSLEVNFSCTLENTSFKKYDNKYIDEVSKFFTKKEITISKDFKGLFLFDLNTCQFTKNLDNTYTIILDVKNLSSEVFEISSPKSVETKNLLGYGYTPEEVLNISHELNQLANNKLNSIENKTLAIQNTKSNLISLFNNVGIDMNKIIINIEGV